MSVSILKILILDAGGPLHLRNYTGVLQTSDQYHYLKRTIILATLGGEKYPTGKCRHNHGNAQLRSTSKGYRGERG